MIDEQPQRLNYTIKSKVDLEPLWQEVSPKEMYHILDELMHLSARLALENSNFQPEGKSLAGHLYYVKLLRDAMLSGNDL